MELDSVTIRRLRQVLSLSQREMAEYLEVGTTTYQRWEQGKNKPQPYHRRRILERFPNELSALVNAIPGEQSTSEYLETEGLASSYEFQNGNPDTRICSISEDSHDKQDLLSVVSTMDFVSFTSEDTIIEDAAGTDVVQTFLSTHMISALWNLAHQDTATVYDMRTLIRQSIKGFDQMNTTNKNYHITRREALSALATLPITTFRLNAPGTTILPARYGDALMHCAAALEGCWELYQSDASNVQLAFNCASKYIPMLEAIAKDSSSYRVEALDLATRYNLLNTLLGRTCTGMSEITLYAKNAVNLGKETGDISLQLSAYTKLAWSYFHNRKWTLAQRVMEEGESVLISYQKSSNNPPLPSSLVGGFYSTHALVQTRNGKNSDRALGIASDSEPSDDHIAFMVFKASTQMEEAALACCYKGDQTQAMKWIEKRIDPETLISRVPQRKRLGHIETVNTLTLLRLKAEKPDMNEAIRLFKFAIEESRAAKHNLSFSQAVANFEAMEWIWPRETEIAKLRPLTEHW